eukprot:GEZU01023739.1.p1 GENE.GEZU01023739.1~~GEZU01023739.1.p1  ORF type:complete len:105 (-),score=28.77 GEZU01023739.1:175-489(-)
MKSRSKRLRYANPNIGCQYISTRSISIHAYLCEQAKLEEYTKEKEEAYSSVTSKMSMIVDKRDKEYVASLCKFMEDLHNYYKECYEVTKELEPHIEKLKWQAQE